MDRLLPSNTKQAQFRANEKRMLRSIALFSDGAGMVKTRWVERDLNVYRGWFGANVSRLKRWGLVIHTRNGYADLSVAGMAVARLLADPSNPNA